MLQTSFTIVLKPVLFVVANDFSKLSKFDDKDKICNSLDAALLEKKWDMNAVLKQWDCYGNSKLGFEIKIKQIAFTKPMSDTD